MLLRPSDNEYDPYFQRYIDLVPRGDLLVLLKDNKEKVVRFFESIPIAKHDHQYAIGKWTIKEVLMHMIDTERVMAYRAFVAARADAKTILHPMDENSYAANVDVTVRSLTNIVEEFNIVRNATLTIYDHLTDAQSIFMATGETHPVTARALGYIIIGHAEHHMHVVTNRYL